MPIFFFSFLAQSQSTDTYAPHTEYQSQTHGQSSEQPTGHAAPHQVDYANSQMFLPTPEHTSHQANYQSYSHDHSPVASQNGTYSQYAYSPYAPGIPARVVKSSSADSGTRAPKDVNAYRPATLNAYDPPISSKARSKARSALYTTQPPSKFPNDVHHQYAGAVQSSPLPPPLPPPPPPAVRAGGVPIHPTSHSAGEQSFANEVLHGLSFFYFIFSFDEIFN